MERIRRFIRSKIGYRSYVYRKASKILNFLITIKKDNFATYKTLKQLASQPKTQDAIYLNLKALRYPIRVRPGTKDSEIIFNDVIREEYGYILHKNPEWIIDAGGYIGDTAVYFMSKYKNSKVIVLEPFEENYNAAIYNLTPYEEQATLLKKGLWGSDGELSFSGESTGGSLTDVADDNKIRVECVSITTLMKKYNIEKIDILKIDIEGAEGNVFDSDLDYWLPRTEMIIIEIHSDELLKTISKKLEGYNFKMIQYRSVWYCVK